MSAHRTRSHSHHAEPSTFVSDSEHPKTTESTVDRLFTKKEGSGKGDCYRCGEPLESLRPSPKSAKQFKKMTGRPFSWPSTSLNIEVDAKSLDATVRAIGRGDFCCDCAVAYMTEFNRLLSVSKAN